MTADYTTVVDFKDWAGIQVGDVGHDQKIGRAIGAASRAIDFHCKRRFWTETGTARVFDTEDGFEVDIDDATAVTAIATDDDRDGSFETVWAASDYQPVPVNSGSEPFTGIRAVTGRRFPLGETGGRLGLIQVTGDWGWDPIPEPVTQACLLVANRIVKRKESPEGVSGFDQFGVIRVSSREDPDAVLLLRDYVKKLVFA